MWALDPVCTFGEEKGAWTRVRVWSPDSSARILVTVLTELFRLTSKCYSRELMSTGAWCCVLKCVAPEVSKDNATSLFKFKHSQNCAAAPQTSQCHRSSEPVVIWQVFVVVTLRQARTAGETGCSSLFDITEPRSCVNSIGCLSLGDWRVSPILYPRDNWIIVHNTFLDEPW